MEKALLHVVSFTLTGRESMAGALRHLRRLCARQESFRCALLLFCDLPDAPARLTPHEAPLIRALLSGVAAMNAQTPDCFFLFVRSRTWDDARRQYLGSRQRLSCRRVIAQLLAKGTTQAEFEAASIPPASLKGKYAAVLFSDASLFCTPDTPVRMFRALSHCSEGMLSAQVPGNRAYPQSVLTRLCAADRFSLSPLRSAQEYALFRQGRCPADHPVIFTAEALIRCSAPPSAVWAEGCFFLRRCPQTIRDIFVAYQDFCRGAHTLVILLPVLQMLVLFAAALSGLPFLAGAAFLPELPALVHPVQWPGGLLRAALLPMTALLSLDTLFCRLLSRSPLLRIRVAPRLISPLACTASAGFLLPAAFLSVHSLFALLPVALLWLSAPLILPALDKPTLERIGLDTQQLCHLRALAEEAYWDAVSRATPALNMLCACAGCMLGVLEADEAARRIQALLVGDFSCASTAEQAAVLASAQYLRERMTDCDAALRALPAQLEDAVLSQTHEDDSTLGVLLHNARSETGGHALPLRISGPADLLFLPLRPIRETPRHDLSLPLTHPHTYLKRQLLHAQAGQSAEAQDASVRFLFLAAAALGHPFYALLQRSPVTGPYVWICSGISS
ncbi:MAG: hypothetical protein IKJ11_09130 [Clostridia bacterium]|nr:hypothetical protein [Clostridia bacterium]